MLPILGHMCLSNEIPTVEYQEGLLFIVVIDTVIKRGLPSRYK